jgi:hypothetical protein
MDPVTMILVPGLIGGAVIALFFFWLQRRHPTESTISPRSPDAPLTDAINMSGIKVAGIGGLGLVAMAVAVALDVPRIGQTVLVGLALGVVLAAVLIARRRRGGAMPSSGEQPGANTTLAIDQAKEPRDPRAERRGSDGPRPINAAVIP